MIHGLSQRVPLPREPILGRDAVAEYDRGARRYMMPEYKYFVRKILRRTRRGRVLDIGTGSGRLAIELALAKDCRFDIVALDISADMLEMARRNARFYSVEDRIEFVHGSADSLPFPDGSFDLVISYASLHHWRRPVTVFNEIARVTGDTGRFIIRDNWRVYRHPVWKAGVWAVSRFMNRRHRENWPKAIMASYTLPEIRQILRRSRLADYRVHKDFLSIDMCIETR